MDSKSHVFKRRLVTVITVMASATWMSACSQTAAPEPNVIQRAQGEAPAPPPPTGFLGSDYSLLTPPSGDSDQAAMLRYLNPNVNWGSYHAIMIVPVTFWADSNSEVTAANQQELCNYAYNTFVTQLGKSFVIVNEPGPGVMKFSVALTDATAAVPVLRSISVVVPQARVLSTLKMAATGTFAFVGSAQGAAKLNDSVSGDLLAAWADKRVGGTSVKNVTVFEWGDAENAINYWADGLDKRLVSLGVQRNGMAAGS